MNTKTTLSISEARAKIFDIAEDVQKPDRYYILTEKGKPKVALLSAEQFESWQETFEVMKDFPNLSEDIKESEQQYAKGEYVTLDQLLEKEGYSMVRDVRNNHALSGSRSKKSKKRTR